MATGIDTVPTNTRVPGAYFGFDTRTGVRSAGVARQNVIVMGEKLPTGAADTNVVYDIVEESDAVTLFGDGSDIHVALRAAMRQYSFGAYHAIAVGKIEDADGGTDPIPLNENGATLDIAAAMEVMKRATYNIIVFPFLDDDSITALKNHIDEASDAINQQAVIAVLANSADKTALKALAAKINHNRIVLVGYKLISDTSQIEVAAAVAANILSQPDPALPFDGDVLIPINTILPNDNWTRNEQEYLLNVGVTPIERLSGGQTAIVRLISTQTNGASADSPDLWIRTLDYVRERMLIVYKENFGKTKLSNRIPDAVRSVFLGEAKSLENAEIVKNVDLWKDNLTVVKSQLNQGFLEARIPADCVLGLHGVIGYVELRI